MPNELRLDAGQIDHALAIALAGAGDERATAAQVGAILEYARQAGGQWQGWQCLDAGALTGLALALVLPGSTALLVAPQPGRHGIHPTAQGRVIAHALASLASQRLHYVQALIEPDDAQSAEVLQQTGFARVTTMLYLERDSRYPWVDPPDSAVARWTPYRESETSRFEQVVARTYDLSSDCPELTGIRPMRDVLLSHRAGGRFRPECWELLEIGGEPAGCILLADLPHLNVAEVAYMGVVPEFRGRGSGALLLRRALELARRIGAQRLTLAVDVRNAPARKLYQRFNFAETAQRAAYFFRCRAL